MQILFLLAANNNFWLTLLGAFGIYLLLPITGVWVYRQLLKRMYEEEIVHPPSMELFVVFATYGGLLIVSLNALFLPWSVASTMLVAYLLFPGPILMGIMAFRVYKHRHVSLYHQKTLQACIAFLGVEIFLFLLLYRIIQYWESM